MGRHAGKLTALARSRGLPLLLEQRYLGRTASISTDAWEGTVLLIARLRLLTT